MESLKDENPAVRNAAAEALNEIDPVAAAKAGIK
jgi:HEAT repeat protein